ncbi:MAG: hypothetical protein H6540_02845 [Bacteroidales bacterium]|nr:hypothetical protein [Bacteroidales bacterium]
MKFLFSIVFIVGFFAANAQVAINSDGSAANPSSMLDVSSTTKGLLPPRMSSAQRTAIPTPANGLIVYDTDSASYYIRNSTGWCQLVMENGAGVTQIGTIADNTTIEADGTVKFNGNATVWDDLVVSPSAAGKNTSPPTWAKFQDNIQLLYFAKGDQIYFTAQLPHSYKVGSPLYPHLHWTTNTGIPSGNDVKWGLEYTVIAIGGVYPVTSTIYVNSIIASITAPYGPKKHLISSFGSISGVNLSISAILVCRLFRDPTDTYSGSDVGLLSFDIHYEKDTEGSRVEFVK